MVPGLIARGLWAACLFLVLQTPAVRFDAETNLVRLEGWARLGEQHREAFPDILAVFVDAPDVPAMVGTYAIDGGALVFKPQFPLEPGVRYRAVARIPGMSPIRSIIDIPQPQLTPTATVTHVYPSAGVLPENQLKFYVHFSESMSRGSVYQYIRLLDEAGNPVAGPFLELGEELWDAETKRFTLFFDPGRIKRGLVPNADMGMALQEGKRYTLVIDEAWRDAQGASLASGFRKTFVVGPAERGLLDPRTWTVQSPRAGGMDPIVVDFPRPMDNALLQRQLDVLSSSGARVAGIVQVDRNETRWLLTPEQPWRAGNYTLQIGNALSDLAGNMVDRPFEIDLFENIEAPSGGFIRSLPITVR